MELDPKLCYRALECRDPRFDGRFFTGVVTTGIYCRPICPARTPLAKNVRFFACAAAAAAAGFRPCRRCRPEAAPGTPAWLGTSATVARGLRLIADGALDRKSVEGLALELGMGSRQLRRLFEQHLGATPVALAQTRRVHFAKKMLDETGLPIGEIAAASGFGSLRRFHFAFRRAFSLAPGAIRRREGHAPGGGAALALRLPYRPPYDWGGILGFLGERAVAGVERVDSGSYRRTMPGGILRVEDVSRQHHLRLTLPAGVASGGLLEIVSRLRRLFDLDADPAAIAAALATDSRLAPLVKQRPGLRVPGAFDGFEVAVRAILGQQVSVAGATTLAGRLARTYGEALTVPGEPGLDRLFPTPERLRKAPLEELGMPGQRAEAIRGLARAVAAGEPVLAGASGLEEAVARLAALPGIGPWTAHYVALRALGEPDAFPAGDLGLRRAMGIDQESRLEERAEAWRPWRGYATMHLWASLGPAPPARRPPARKSK